MAERIFGGRRNIINKRHYRLIGKAHIENILSDLDNSRGEIDKVIIPYSLNEWFSIFLAERMKSELKDKKLFSKSSFSKTAVVFLILIFLTACVSLSLKPVRAKVFDFFITTYEKFAEILSGTKTGDIQRDNNNDSTFYPEYLPDGYFFTDRIALDTTTTYFFSNNEGDMLEFTMSDKGAALQIDTEGAVFREVAISGFDGIISFKDDKTILIWYNDVSTFVISGRISMEDIVRMAENIK